MSSWSSNPNRKKANEVLRWRSERQIMLADICENNCSYIVESNNWIVQHIFTPAVWNFTVKPHELPHTTINIRALRIASGAVIEFLSLRSSISLPHFSIDLLFRFVEKPLTVCHLKLRDNMRNSRKRNKAKSEGKLLKVWQKISGRPCSV